MDSRVLRADGPLTIRGSKFDAVFSGFCMDYDSVRTSRQYLHGKYQREATSYPGIEMLLHSNHKDR